MRFLIAFAFVMLTAANPAKAITTTFNIEFSAHGIFPWAIFGRSGDRFVHRHTRPLCRQINLRGSAILNSITAINLRLGASWFQLFLEQQRGFVHTVVRLMVFPGKAAVRTTSVLFFDDLLGAGNFRNFSFNQTHSTATGCVLSSRSLCVHRICERFRSSAPRSSPTVRHLLAGGGLIAWRRKRKVITNAQAGAVSRVSSSGVSRDFVT